jgi:hypothetical protein
MARERVNKRGERVKKAMLRKFRVVMYIHRLPKYLSM